MTHIAVVILSIEQTSGSQTENCAGCLVWHQHVVKKCVFASHNLHYHVGIIVVELVVRTCLFFFFLFIQGEWSQQELGEILPSNKGMF